MLLLSYTPFSALIFLSALSSFQFNQLKAVLDRAQGEEINARGPIIQEGIADVLREAEEDGTTIPKTAAQHLQKSVHHRNIIRRYRVRGTHSVYAHIV